LVEEPTTGRLPIPDPTLLTTEQLRRELSGLRELMETRLDAMDEATRILKQFIDSTVNQRKDDIANLEKFLEARLDGMDKTHYLLGDLVNKLGIENKDTVDHLKELHAERFVSIQKQFDERDVRARASEEAAKTAVNAALQAQKEAAGAQNESNAVSILKSEAGTTKQIDGILALLASNTKNIDDKISVINGRLDRGDGSINQQHEYRSNNYMNTGSTLGIIAGAVGMISLFVVIVFGIITVYHQGAQPTVVSPAVIPVTPK
jgi:hypothetical protein